MVLLLFLVSQGGTGHALHYLESRSFTEPAFVFVIMVMAASRPIIDFAGALLHFLCRALPLKPTPCLLLHGAVDRTAARLLHH